MQFLVLGPLEVRDGDELRTLRRGRPRSLLHLLLLNRRAVLPAEVVADRLWPGDVPQDGLNAVHQLVSYVRRSLGARGREFLLTTPTGYRLDATDDQVDAWGFERLVHSAIQGVRAPGAESAARALAEAEGAIRLWRGEPFAESADYEWAAGERARLRDTFLQAHESRLDALLTLGRHSEVVLDAQSLVAAYPLRENLHLRLALALYRTGRQSEALEAHRAVRELLARELAIDPGPELRSQERAILNQDSDLDWEEPHDLQRHVDVVPPVPAPVVCEEPASHRVIGAPSAMLGRDAELSLVLARLLPGNVCTVTGPAGVGKTRFALALALARAEDHPWWSVDLRGVDSDDHVALAVADRLVGHADPHHGSTERVCAALRDSEGTLVLDSCEHLVSGVTDLIAKLQATALQLRLVVTSRRPLGIGAEVVHKLAPLPVPEATCVDADALARNEAVLLFAARAQLVKVDLALDASNLRDIGAIVRCLDGLPMAIELAAAQADVGTLAAIRRRIETHLESLVEDNAQLPSRSRSLLAAITGSVVLLDQDERRMLLSCSVFPGSFTTAGAASVSELDEGATYRLLVALVRQSLVSVDGDDTYKLLAPIRAYARSRAQDELLLPGLRRRHPDWVASVAWTAWAHSGDLRERQDLRELTPLLADARAALDWALEEQHLPAATQIAVAFSWVWTMQGLASEGLGHLLRVKALSDQMPPENAQAAAERAALLRSVGLVANPMGKLELARDVCSDAVALSVQHGDTDGAAAALLTLAVAQWAFGDLQGATSALDSGVDLTQSRPESWYFLAARVLRARTALDAGEPDAAALVGAAVDLTQESGDQHLTGLAMACQARLLLSTGDVEAAVLVAGEAFRVWRSINYREGEVMALNLLSRCSAELGETDQGQASAREALLIGRRAGHRGAMCDSLESFACNAAVAGRREQALLLLSVSERERERLGAPIPAGDRTHVESTKLALREALGDTVRLVLARARLIRFDELVEELSR